ALLLPISSHPPPSASHTLSLHDALPICLCSAQGLQVRYLYEEVLCSIHHNIYICARSDCSRFQVVYGVAGKRHGEHLCRENISRSEEHTSELQSRFDLVCRLLLEKNKNE